jgi:hypothetical protein
VAVEAAHIALEARLVEVEWDEGAGPHCSQSNSATSLMLKRRSWVGTYCAMHRYINFQLGWPSDKLTFDSMHEVHCAWPLASV